MAQRVFRDWKVIRQLEQERRAPKRTLYKVKLATPIMVTEPEYYVPTGTVMEVIGKCCTPAGEYLRLRSDCSVAIWIKASSATKC